MERRTREELALMGKEELEAIILHLQDEVSKSSELTVKAVKEKNDMIARAKRIETRLDVLMELLKAWQE